MIQCWWLHIFITFQLRMKHLCHEMPVFVATGRMLDGSTAGHDRTFFVCNSFGCVIVSFQGWASPPSKVKDCSYPYDCVSSSSLTDESIRALLCV